MEIEKRKEEFLIDFYKKLSKLNSYEFDLFINILTKVKDKKFTAYEINGMFNDKSIQYLYKALNKLIDLSLIDYNLIQLKNTQIKEYFIKDYNVLKEYKII